jgi:two-component system response regulator BaeR
MNSPAHILIVEDDAKIAAILSDYLNAAGFSARCIADGRHAVDALRGDASNCDLVILDLMLPGLDGIGVCREVRQFSQVPIIMLTARVDEIDRLMGLDSGADDYVCKPFSPREVVARVRAHLRRGAVTRQAAAGVPETGQGPAAVPGQGQGQDSAPERRQLRVDRAGMRITYRRTALALTPVEFRLLAELIDHPGRVYSRQQLLDLAHVDQRDISDRTVDSHIKNIRRKVAVLLPDADCVQSVYGVGYRFEFA